MSRNQLTTTSPFGNVQIAAGWDNPTREVYCHVEFLAEEEPDPFPVDLLETNYADVDAMVEKLTRSGINLPTEMVAKVREDVATRAGNVIRDFSPDGSLVREVDLREHERSSRGM